MNIFFRNRISKLCNAVSASAATTRDSLSKRLQRIRETDSLLYNKMTDNIEYGRERLKDNVEKEAREEEEETTEQTGENVNLAAAKNEKTLKDANRNFMKSGKAKVDIDIYFYQVNLYIKELINDQLKEIQTANIIMTLWVVWKKSLKVSCYPRPLIVLIYKQ